MMEPYIEMHPFFILSDIQENNNEKLYTTDLEAIIGKI